MYELNVWTADSCWGLPAGGDDEAYLQYAERLGQVTTQYEHVVFIGAHTRICRALCVTPRAVPR